MSFCPRLCREKSRKSTLLCCLVTSRTKACTQKYHPPNQTQVKGTVPVGQPLSAKPSTRPMARSNETQYTCPH
eukprot:217657-Amphidinium_carterae.3